MSSETIYTRTPYFYIIQHKINKKLYAGCRFAKKCHPSEFLKIDGYCTSSRFIKDEIAINGVEIFDIVQLLTEDICGIPVLDYETLFLRSNDIASRENWYNTHNNTATAFGSDQFKKNMMNKYGVKNSMQIPQVRGKVTKTCMKKYGFSTNLLDPEMLERVRKERFERIGYECNLSDPKQIQSNKEFWFQKYGVDNPSKAKEVIDEIAATKLERTGYDCNFKDPVHVSQWEEKYKEETGYNNPRETPWVKEKIANTLMERTGYSTTFANPATQAKSKETIQQKYGVTNVMHDPEIKERQRKTSFERTGYANPLDNPDHRKHTQKIRKERSKRPIVLEIKALLKTLKIPGHKVGMKTNWWSSEDSYLEPFVILLRSMVEVNKSQNSESFVYECGLDL